MTIHHKRLREEPISLSIINPVYDAQTDADLNEKNDPSTKAAQNNNEELVVRHREANGKHFPQSATAYAGSGDSGLPKSATDDGKKSSNGKTETHPDHVTVVVLGDAQDKGTEHLIPYEGQGFCRRHIRTLIIVAVIAVILVVAGISAYLIYSHAHKESQPIYVGHASQQGEMSGVRLRGGAIANEGLLELFINNEWQAVCDDGWSMEDAFVACKELGFGFDVQSAQRKSKHVAATNLNFSIGIRGVQCLGNESSVRDCLHSTVTESECTRTEAVHLHCRTAEDMEPVELRLVTYNATLGIGRLELLYNSSWGSVCNSYWSHSEALVACRQLNYSTVLQSKVQDTEFIPLVNLSAPIWLDNVQCNGSEGNLAKCNHLGWGEHNSCNHNMDVVIQCGHVPVSSYSTQVLEQGTGISLVANSSRSSLSSSLLSQVELTTSQLITPVHVQALPPNTRALLMYGLEYGSGLLILDTRDGNVTMCDDHWTNSEALVACRQLGFTTVTSKHDNFMELSIDDVVALNIWPTKINCQGTESRLSDCSFENHISVAQCSHHEDVKLSCGPKPSSPDLALTSPSSSSVTLVTTVQLTTMSSTTERVTSASSTSISTTPSAEEKHEPTEPRLESFDVRLNHGINGKPEAGRLEVLHNGTWGRVCMRDWTPEDARVVCRQLGFSDVDEYSRIAERDGVVRGDPNQPIWISKVMCLGNESTLSVCPHIVMQDGSCTHFDVVMMSCKTQEAVSTAPRNGDLRLVPGPHEGRLESFLDGYWGSVCDSGWDKVDATVACRQLNYSNVSAAVVPRSLFPNITDKLDFFVSEVQCLGPEAVLSNCSQRTPGDSDCRHFGFWGMMTANTEIFLSCDPSSQIIEANQRVIRLVNGLEDEHKGLLQYLRDGNWGTVCSSGWSEADARVACRQLGFPGVLQTNISVSDVRGIPQAVFSSPIHATEMRCRGTETYIWDCPHLSVASNCHHSQDVAIVCAPLPSTNRTSNITDETVRLVNGSTQYEGIVQVLINGTWGYICDDHHWSNDNMAYLCYALFRKQHFERMSGTAFTGPYIAGRFSCQLNEDAFNQCTHVTDQQYLQSCTRPANVRCL